MLQVHACRGETAGALSPVYTNVALECIYSVRTRHRAGPAVTLFGRLGPQVCCALAARIRRKTTGTRASPDRGSCVAPRVAGYMQQLDLTNFCGSSVPHLYYTRFANFSIPNSALANNACDRLPCALLSGVVAEPRSESGKSMFPAPLCADTWGKEMKPELPSAKVPATKYPHSGIDASEDARGALKDIGGVRISAKTICWAC
ncbi:hypothetical protein BDU57DRAFT_526349 [Ampelomyces quisqualis]|uniref:Uncharacterized protein n=1 Tax=Ampelomyces quisqualis TaxID=50730 RepID=A0A6A5R1L9_AMPQU|nr:hypothetical protein BDU57DRAFT_526349 [Ampelomyces quisqualis]